LSVWPSFAAQQKICKRRDTAYCVAVGSPGCELCTPCQYTDEQLTARGLPVSEIRARHGRDVAELPLMCAGCFSDRPREARETLVAGHLVSLYGKKPQDELDFLRRAVGRNVAGFSDEQLLKARDWSGYEWRQWMDANLPAPGASG
jgi:hypothetical protein